MTVLYPENKLDVLNEIQLRIIEAANRVGRGMAKLPWLLALIPLLIVGLAMTSVLYFPLVLARRKVMKLTRAVLEEVDNMGEREAMLIHAGVEEMRRRFDDIKKGPGGPDKFFVFRPLVNEMEKTARQYQAAEEALLRKAYPNFDKPLTPQQTQTLIQAFKVWRDEDGKQATQLVLID